MNNIIRHGINEEWAHASMVEAGGFVWLGYCVGNIGQSVEAQVEGALNDMAARLATLGLGLDAVVKVDVLLRDVWNIPIMEAVFRRRFQGKYPARKTIGTDFAHVGGPDGLQVQIDGVAWRGVTAA